MNHLRLLFPSFERRLPLTRDQVVLLRQGRVRFAGGLEAWSARQGPEPELEMVRPPPLRWRWSLAASEYPASPGSWPPEP